MPKARAQAPIHLVQALDVLSEVRENAVVVTSMGSAREWVRRFDPHPFDFVHVPSSMGQTPAIGLGIALAQPARRVITCVGDGSLLMNLGCLATIAAAKPENFVLIVFDNGAYEVTGGQPTPVAGGAPQFDFAMTARAAGFVEVESLDNLADWRDQASQLIHLPGPVCLVLRVQANPSAGPVDRLPPAGERARAFAAALQGDDAPRHPPDSSQSPEPGT